MQIPVLNGITTDAGPDMRRSYPRNLIPVPVDNGISKGYLRPADGVALFGTGPGTDRGGINWNGVMYRVMGTKLVSVSSGGVVTVLGDVGGSGQVTLDYSFDRIGIASSGNLYYWDGATLTQVIDPDLGTVVDVLWVDGYWMTTDGTHLVVTDLSDPMSVNPLKYGSSEIDPDPVKGLIKLRGEVYALNRYTIEVFRNVGGDLFPFERIDGALIPRGVVGTWACNFFLGAIAFVGSARNESPAVWLALNGDTTKLSTREIDTILAGYSESVLATAVMEARVDRGHQQIVIHLPDQALVYDGAASQVVGEPVWHTRDSGTTTPATYRARNLVWCYDKWLAGDPTTAQVGELVQTLSSHFGVDVGWQFDTAILYNEGRGAIFHEVELVCLTGRVALLADPLVYTSYSLDGMQFSAEQSTRAGRNGELSRRICWRSQGTMRHWRVQRFRGSSDAHLAVARLEIQVEALGA